MGKIDVGKHACRVIPIMRSCYPSSLSPSIIFRLSENGRSLFLRKILMKPKMVFLTSCEIYETCMKVNKEFLIKMQLSGITSVTAVTQRTVAPGWFEIFHKSHVVISINLRQSASHFSSIVWTFVETCAIFHVIAKRRCRKRKRKINVKNRTNTTIGALTMRGCINERYFLEFGYCM